MRTKTAFTLLVRINQTALIENVMQEVNLFGSDITDSSKINFPVRKAVIIFRLHVETLIGKYIFLLSCHTCSLRTMEPLHLKTQQESAKVSNYENKM